MWERTSAATKLQNNMRVSWIVWPWGQFIQKVSRALRVVVSLWPRVLNEATCWFSSKTAILLTAIAEKPCDAFEYRLNHDKVERRVSCLTFKSRFYDKVCQSNEVAKLRLIWGLAPYILYGIKHLWIKLNISKSINFFKKIKTSMKIQT